VTAPSTVTDFQDVVVSIVGFGPIGNQPRRWTVPTCLVNWSTTTTVFSLSSGRFFDRLLELSLLLGISLVVARPCCPQGQPGLSQQLVRIVLVVFNTVLLFDVVKQELG
jgi:hypothetical protein